MSTNPHFTLAFFLPLPTGFTYDIQDASEDSLAICIPEANQAEQQRGLRGTSYIDKVEASIIANRGDLC
eukprot:scaffold26712_cov87-Skeletonema_marinoi.AAC.1